MGTAVTVELRLTRQLLESVQIDLSRPHPFAAERVTFLTAFPASLGAQGLVLLAAAHHPVQDEHYERDDTVGAMLGAAAFRRMLQVAYNSPVSILHVHRHDHRGNPWFSSVDIQEARRYVPDFWKVRNGFPHGIVVLSYDAAAGLIWLPGFSNQVRISRITIVGAPTKEIRE